MSFTHLHVFSIDTLYNSTLQVEEAVDKAIQLGMNALAITNHHHLYGTYEFAQYARKVSPVFKTIIGCQMLVYPFHDSCSKEVWSWWLRITVICKNEEGYKNLCKLLNDSFTRSGGAY